MTKFGKTIIFVLLLAVGGVVYFFVSRPDTRPSVEDFVTQEGVNLVYKENTDQYTIEAIYPENGVVSGDANVFVYQEIAEFKAILNKVPDEMISFPYSLMIGYETKEGAGLTSYIFTVYNYTGGAHGNTYIKTFTYDKEGARVTFSDSIKKGEQNIQAISRFVEMTLRNNTEEGMSFFEEGFAPESENFENFYIDGDHIVFMFPPYQVAPYSFGLLEARIALDQVFGYFKKNIFENFEEKVSEFRGFLVYGSEVREFSYCDDEQVFWYQDTTGSLADEYDHAKQSEEPYEKLPVILEGYIRKVATSVDGEFASLRDGLLVVTDLAQVGGGGVCPE